MSFETSDNLPRYFRTISKLQQLTAEEEKALASRIQVGDLSALNMLVKHNLRLVISIANRHIGQGVPIDDLIQEGNLGLHDAARKYDPSEGTRFATYASLWIRKRINEAVVAHGRIVRLPHNQEYELYKMKQAGEETPNLSTVDIDANISDDSDTRVGDLLLRTQAEIEQLADTEQVIFEARQALNELKERDRKIVAAYFGIDAEYEMPTDVIAERFDMTNVRVCQIIKGSLQKMRDAINKK